MDSSTRDAMWTIVLICLMSAAVITWCGVIRSCEAQAEAPAAAFGATR